LSLAAAAALLLVIGVRVCYVFSHHVNGDEPQHLHVVWAWTQGLLPYRDVFDNHTPLFHLLMAPLFAAFGERADILIPMRLAMIPLFLGMLALTYRIGRTLFSRAVGFWAAILTGLFPLFFLTTVEFRPDNLWTVLWLLALAIAISGPFSPARSWLLGLVLGAAVSVSMKTVTLLAGLGVAAVSVAYLEHRRGRLPIERLFRHLWRGALGFLSIPGALVLLFAWHGALGSMYYGVVQHNLVPGLDHWNEGFREDILLVSPLPFLAWLAPWPGRGADEPLAIPKVLILLTTVFSSVLIYAFWPLLTPQDLLPIAPLVMVFIAALLVRLRRVRPRLPALGLRWPVIALVLPAAIATAESASLLSREPPVENRTAELEQILQEVLELTGPQDFVMDLKGGTVFRRRPFYFALETITRARISLGLIADTIPEELVATRTCVATEDNWWFPPKGRRFLQEHYIPVGHLRVVGERLGPPEGTDGIAFDIAVPARYALVQTAGPVKGGWLDGKPYLGPSALRPGRHVFRPPAGTVAPLAVVWARAVAHGLSPFSPAVERARL
jgi:4-amino-4-deoxy-L-arabinose transferase-like glycosyltransferase